MCSLPFPDHRFPPRSDGVTGFHLRDSLSFARASGCAKKRVRPQSRHTTSTNFGCRKKPPRPGRTQVRGRPRSRLRSLVQACFRRSWGTAPVCPWASVRRYQYDITLIFCQGRRRGPRAGAQGTAGSRPRGAAALASWEVPYAWRRLRTNSAPIETHTSSARGTVSAFSHAQTEAPRPGRSLAATTRCALGRDVEQRRAEQQRAPQHERPEAEQRGAREPAQRVAPRRYRGPRASLLDRLPGLDLGQSVEQLGVLVAERASPWRRAP